MNAATESSQHLTFESAQELYALDIAKAGEVMEFTAATKVPCTPYFMRGLINPRGNMVPVVDMRLKLGLTRTERTVNTGVVITEVAVDGAKTVLGALAHSVQELIALHAAPIVPLPRMGTRIDTDVIRGMGRRDDHFLIILDIDRMFTADEVRAVNSQASPQA